jgi:hypothetical protein
MYARMHVRARADMHFNDINDRAQRCGHRTRTS